MNALHLTTRFNDGAYQGEACLLVYDEQHLSGAALSQDVRNLFEHRPATGRVYILAPFLAEDEVRHAFHDGALFSRIRSYFHATGGRLYLLTFLGLLSEKRIASFAILRRKHQSCLGKTLGAVGSSTFLTGTGEG
jgi:hypothetical protein